MARTSIKQAWIVSESGIMIHPASNDSAQAIGAIMVAIFSIATRIDDEGIGINAFQLASKKFVVGNRNGLYFVGSHDDRADGLHARRDLEKLMDHFFDAYPPERVRAWNGDPGDRARIDIVL